MKNRHAVLAVCSLMLCGCGGGPRPDDGRERPAPFHPPTEILQRYDSDHDGVLTRAEMEAGLKADFAQADTNHDGRLDADEMRAVNDQRWKDNASTTSTLVDWNQDGFVDFSEFAGTARSLFAQLDRNADGVLTAKEWRPEKPGAKPDGQGDGAPAPKP